MPAQAAPTVLTYSSESGPNTAPFTTTMTGVGFGSVTKAILYLPGAVHPTIPAEDVNANGTLDCIEATNAQTASSPRCRIGTLGTQGVTSLTATFPTIGVAPSDEWRVYLRDSDGTSAVPCASAGCITITAVAPTVASVSSSTEGTPPRRGQGAAPVQVTVTGQDFWPGTTLAESAADPDDLITISAVTLTLGTGSAADTLSATVALAEDVAVGDDVLRVLNTDASSVRVDFDIVAGPKLTSITPISRGRGGSVALTLAGTGLVPGSTTLSSPTSGITISGSTVSSATTASATAAIAADTVPGPATVTAMNPGTGGRGSNTFEVLPDFQITSIAPSTFRTTAANRTVTIKGSNFRSSPMPTITFSPTGIIAFDDAGSGLAVPDSNTISFRIDVQPAATIGRIVDVIVVPNDGGPPRSTTLEIVGVPDVTAYAPAAVGRGAVDAQVTFVGSYLDPTSGYSFSGTGVSVGSCVKAEGGIRCLVGVTPDAALSGRDLTISQPDEVAVIDSNPKLQVAEAPTLTAISPSSLGQGAAGKVVALTGTGFLPGPGLGVALGQGVTSSACQRSSATQATCVLAVASDAATGARTPSVINGDYGRSACSCSMTINPKPQISTLSPDLLSRGASTQVTFSGQDLVSGAVVLLGPGVTASATTGSGTSVTATVSVAQEAPLGTHAVSVTNPDGGTSTCAADPCLTIEPPLAIRSVVPAARGAGATQQVIAIDGDSLADAAVVAFGPGITVTDSGRDGNAFTATIDVAENAAPGPRDLTITNPDGSMVTCAACFSVAAIPTIVSFAPTSVGAGAVDFPVTVSGTGFLPGALAQLGDEANAKVEVISPTELRLLVSVVPGATLGEIDVTIRNDNGGTPATCVAADDACLELTAAPTFTSLAPARLPQGAEARTLTATGSGILPGATMSLGDGVEELVPTDVSDTQVTVVVTLEPSIATGARDATLVNGDGGRATLTDGLEIVPGPKVTEASPFQLEAGTRGVTVTGSGFVAGLTATIDGGITVRSVTVTSSSQLTLTVTVPSSAPVGVRDLTVRNSDGGRGVGASVLGVGDRVADAVMIQASGYLDSGPYIDFYDRVTGIDANNIVLAERDGDVVVPTAVSCRGLAGETVACDGGQTRRAILTPVGLLTAGQYYRTTVNPAGTAPVTTSEGSAVPTRTAVFRGHRWIQDPFPTHTYAWEIVKTSEAAGGKYVRERLAGARVLGDFEGDQVTWTTLVGPDQGRASVVVDGNLVAIIDNSATKTRFGVLRTFSGFGPGLHTLMLYVRGEGGARGGPAYVSVDAFGDSSGTARNPKLTYRWSLRDEPLVSSVSISRSLTREAAMFTEARGTGVSLAMIAGPDQGKAQLFVDGVLRKTVDLYAPTRRVVKVGAGGLTDTLHRIKLRVLGKRAPASRGTEVTFDELTVY